MVEKNTSPDEMRYKYELLREAEWVELENGRMLLEDEVWGVVWDGETEYIPRKESGEWVFDVFRECVYAKERENYLKEFAEYMQSRWNTKDDLSYTPVKEGEEWRTLGRGGSETYEPVILNGEVSFKRMPEVLTGERAKLAYQSLSLLLKFSDYGKTLYESKPLLMLPAPEEVLLLPEKTLSSQNYR